MKIVDNKILNVIFQVTIAVALAGLVMYLIQEIITIWEGSAYTVFIIIADFIGIVALVTFIVWMFMSDSKNIALNIALIFGATYVLLYSFAHFFVVQYRNNTGDPPGAGTTLGNYIDSGVSLMGLIFLVLSSILMIVVFAFRFVKRSEKPTYEKFAILVWLLLIGIYDFSGFYYVKQSITFGTPASPLSTYLGLSFLPTTLELILILFALILISLKLFGSLDPRAETVLILTLANAIFICFAISTVNSIGFNPTDPTRIPSVIGNHFIMASTLATIIISFIMLIKQHGVGSRARRRNT
jgi:hypothetical protein